MVGVDPLPKQRGTFIGRRRRGFGDWRPASAVQCGVVKATNLLAKVGQRAHAMFRF